MCNENSDDSPNQNSETIQAKQDEIRNILQQLIRLIAIEIAIKIKSTQTKDYSGGKDLMT